MHCISKIWLLLLISRVLSQEQHPQQLRILDQLIRKIGKMHKVETLFMLQHHGANNCLTEGWSANGIPTLRSNELATFEVKKTINTLHSLAVVCISQKSDVKLLDNLAKSYENMRQERIILWVQMKATQEILQEIGHLAETHSFLRIVILETGSLENGTTNLYKLEAFPAPHFNRIGNISDFKGTFFGAKLNFHGKTAILMEKRTTFLHFNTSFGNLGEFALRTQEDMQILHFAQRTNLSLKLKQDNRLIPGHFDLQLSPRLLAKRDVSESANSFTVVSLIVVVPCAKERSIQDVFKQLDCLDWAMYILPVYVTFVIVEGLIYVVTSRVGGQSERLSYLNQLINLRAIGAILGHSISLHHRWSPSRRQLFITLSIFGFVFSNFVACKLSALLTKHSRYAQITNFEELLASGLPVLIGKDLLHYIRDEFEDNFIHKIVPNVVAVQNQDKMNRLLELNDSFAYVIHEDAFCFFDGYQRARGARAFCNSRNLTIVSNLPKMFYLPRNSLYKWPLRNFIGRTHEVGIHMRWKSDFLTMLGKKYNLSKELLIPHGATPLSFEDFNFLWFLLIFGYGIATLVFFIEMVCGGNQNFIRTVQPNYDVSIA
ncbi:hypothetical protein KR084_000729 [Drosophila pseudotakahashii]|nr:hypothetical protein KR084_000729 [Drosophila pseudotakahashii]